MYMQLTLGVIRTDILFVGNIILDVNFVEICKQLPRLYSNFLHFLSILQVRAESFRKPLRVLQGQIDKSKPMSGKTVSWLLILHFRLLVWTLLILYWYCFISPNAMWHPVILDAGEKFKHIKKSAKFEHYSQGRGWFFLCYLYFWFCKDRLIRWKTVMR